MATGNVEVETHPVSALQAVGALRQFKGDENLTTLDSHPLSSSGAFRDPDGNEIYVNVGESTLTTVIRR